MGLERKRALSAAAANTVCYERRRPEETTQYRLWREHLEAFLAQVESWGAASLSEFVKHEFDGIVACGPAHGFLRLRCAGCGEKKVIAYSCKRRSICASCGAWCTVETAAWLVDPNTESIYLALKRTRPNEANSLLR